MTVKDRNKLADDARHGKNMRATQTDLWWLRLYNAPPTDVRYTLTMDRMRELGLSEQTIRTLVPQVMDAIDQHWVSYKHFVDSWLANTLTMKDWMKARIWLGREIQHDEFFPDPTNSVQPSSTIVRLMKTNPNELLANAYTQVVSRIARERFGLPFNRPLCCSDCHHLFEPRQHPQRWCSKRCRNRGTMQAYRAKQRRIPGSTESPMLKGQHVHGPHIARTP